MKRRFGFVVIACLLAAVALAGEQVRYLVLTDIHLKQDSQAMDFTPRGYNPANDLDAHSFQRLLQPIRQRAHGLDDLNGIFVLGDLLGHQVTARRDVLLQALTAIKALNLPSYFVFGNNDSLLGDYRAFESDDKQSLYTLVKSVWGSENGFVPQAHVSIKLCQSALAPCAFNQNALHGYYAAWIKPGLAVVALNSVLFDAHATQAMQQHADEQLLWLRHVLMQLAQQQASVLLLMHEPPVTNLYTGNEHWHANAGGDPKRYEVSFLHSLSDAVAAGVNFIAVLAGHSHYDETHALRLSNSAVVPVFITPGLSTSHGNSPGIKIVNLQFDDATQRWRLDDVVAYHALDASQPAYTEYGSRLSQFCAPLAVKQCVMTFPNRLPQLMQWVSEHYVAGNPNQQLPRFTDPKLLLHTDRCVPNNASAF